MPFLSLIDSLIRAGTREDTHGRTPTTPAMPIPAFAPPLLPRDARCAKVICSFPAQHAHLACSTRLYRSVKIAARWSCRRAILAEPHPAPRAPPSGPSSLRTGYGTAASPRGIGDAHHSTRQDYSSSTRSRAYVAPGAFIGVRPPIFTATSVHQRDTPAIFGPIIACERAPTLTPSPRCRRSVPPRAALDPESVRSRPAILGLGRGRRLAHGRTTSLRPGEERRHGTS